MPDIQQEEILTAHRQGIKIPGKLRQMIVRCAPALKDKVFNFTKNLKGVTNSAGNPYYIERQLPEPLFTQRKELQQRIAEVRKTNQQVKEEAQKVKIEVKRRTLILDGIPQRQHVPPPMVVDLFNIDATTQEKLEKLKFSHSVIPPEKSSIFNGYAIKVNNATEVKNAYLRVKQLAPEADHIIMAYHI